MKSTAALKQSIRLLSWTNNPKRDRASMPKSCAMSRPNGPRSPASARYRAASNDSGWADRIYRILRCASSIERAVSEEIDRHAWSREIGVLSIYRGANCHLRQGRSTPAQHVASIQRTDVHRRVTLGRVLAPRCSSTPRAARQMARCSPPVALAAARLGRVAPASSGSTIPNARQ
jgi:hypothetical protein